jgi:heme-degrading monooxygenase HmoA
MAVLVTARIPNQSEKEAAVWHERNRALPSQPGFIFQGDGPVDGGWQIVSAWRSREDFERYFEEMVKANIPNGSEQPAGAMTIEELASVVTA